MGHIYEDHGRVSVEGRRESFIIHAAYGSKPFQAQAGTLSLRQRLRLDGDRKTTYLVVGQKINKTTLRALRDPEQTRPVEFDISSDVYVWPLDGDGASVTVDDPDDPLGESWKHRHPEFALEDLDDLIAALESYREAKKA